MKYYYKIMYYPVIGEKNNQSSVSDADEKLQPSGETRFRQYLLTVGFGALGLHRRPMIDYIFIIYLSMMLPFLADIECRIKLTFSESVALSLKRKPMTLLNMPQETSNVPM